MTMNKRSRASKVAACLLIQAFVPIGLVYAGKQLTQMQAEELLLNTPTAITAKENHGCPRAQLLWQYERQSSLVFSMRDPCSKADLETSDLVGIYAVDVKRAEVWQGADRLRDRSNLIDSPRLKELRREFLGRRK
jgi:hypothetical protein